MSKSTNNIYLTIAQNHRIRASDELFDRGSLSEQIITYLKNDIVNLTNLHNPTKEQSEEATFNISIINAIIDKHYHKLFEASFEDKQERLSFEFTREVKNHH